MITLTEEMFKTHAPQPIAQGEVTIWMKKYAPKEIVAQLSKGKLKELKLEKDRLIVGHSETGHHHVIEAIRPNVHVSKAAQALIDETNDLFIDLKLHEDCKVTHLREHDTHTGFMLPAGDYIIRPDDEQSVKGWTRVQD
jgi:hypothetical protein